MRWKMRPPREQVQLDEWHPVFIYFPRVIENMWVWGEQVERRVHFSQWLNWAEYRLAKKKRK